jgi:cell division protein FtsB
MTKDIGWEPPTPPKTEEPFKGLTGAIGRFLLPLVLAAVAYWFGANYIRF